jgi:hypothetical protein
VVCISVPIDLVKSSRMAGDDFERKTQGFLNWFKALPGASFSDSIQIVDLRSRNAGRGISMIGLTSQLDEYRS